MSINFRIYGRDDIQGRGNDMNVNDLIEGQTIIRIYTPNMRWGAVNGQFRTEEYTVAKILKTRLVLERKSDGQELRMLIETSKYSTWRSGEVKTDREGNTQSYSREAIELATEDEEEAIESLRNFWESRIQEQADLVAAKNAVEGVKKALDGIPNLQKVEDAIAALQAIADNLRNGK
jgi:hypothetical protein